MDLNLKDAKNPERVCIALEPFQGLWFLVIVSRWFFETLGSN